MSDEQSATRVVEGAAAHLEFAKWICAAKTPYSTRGKSKAMAQQRLDRDPTLKALYGYRCAACKTWHLTKKKTGKALAQVEATPAPPTAQG